MAVAAEKIDNRDLALASGYRRHCSRTIAHDFHLAIGRCAAGTWLLRALQNDSSLSQPCARKKIPSEI